MTHVGTSTSSARPMYRSSASVGQCDACHLSPTVSHKKLSKPVSIHNRSGSMFEASCMGLRLWLIRVSRVCECSGLWQVIARRGGALPDVLGTHRGGSRLLYTSPTCQITRVGLDLLSIRRFELRVLRITWLTCYRRFCLSLVEVAGAEEPPGPDPAVGGAAGELRGCAGL